MPRIEKRNKCKQILARLRENKDINLSDECEAFYNWFTYNWPNLENVNKECNTEIKLNFKNMEIDYGIFINELKEPNL